MEDIALHCDVQLCPGTLHGAITRLVENGWIEPLDASGRQRPYRLTASRHVHLKAHLEQMRKLVNLELRRLRTA